MNLEDLQIYRLSMELGEKIWRIVSEWNYFYKDTIGKQLVRSTDSVAANIAEGFGRYHFREAKNFSYYARGSLYETKTWLAKAVNRKLIMEKEWNSILEVVNVLGEKINNFINSIGKQNTNNN